MLPNRDILIQDIHLLDAGTFTCVATNLAGSDTMDIVVTVRGLHSVTLLEC